MISSLMMVKNANETWSFSISSEEKKVFNQHFTCIRSFPERLTNCRLECWIPPVWKRKLIEWNYQSFPVFYKWAKSVSRLPVFLIPQIWWTGRFFCDCSNFIERQPIHQTTVVEVALSDYQVRHGDTVHRMINK